MRLFAFAATFVMAFSASCVAALENESQGATLLRLGPLRRAEPIAAPAARGVPTQYELEVARTFPREGESVAVAPGLGGPLAWTAAAPGEPGLYWYAVYASIDRFAEVTVVAECDGKADVFVDGAAGKSKSMWRRGKHDVLLRCDGTLRSLSIVASGDAKIDRSLDPVRGLADYAETKRFGSVASPSLSPDGRYLAYVVKECELDAPSARRLEIVEFATGNSLATGLLGAATPVAWTADSSRLLLRSGEDLLLYSVANRRLAPALVGEKGVGTVALAPDGSFLVYASGAGVPEPKGDGPRRRTNLREKLTDWPTAPHLFVAAIGGGSKRRLTLPGDCAHDSFALHPDGDRLLWTRSVTRDVRPWFATEFHELSLRTGDDRVITTLEMGFENRPGLTPLKIAPDGSRAAFLAPRSELGARAEVEPNVFDPDLWLLDLASGAAVNATLRCAVSPDATFAWSADSRRIFFTGAVEGRSSGFELDLSNDEFAVREWEAAPRGGAYSGASYSATGQCALIASTPDRPAVLRTVGAAGDFEVRPNDALLARLRFVAPERLRTRLPDGTPSADAWLYRPPGEGDAPASQPLVVYYYGGANPTMYGFSDLHQYLVANGYALLVVNPRGCGSYGDEWSLAHIGDWGETAGDDIVAALDAALAAHPELDATRVGCYGGSYGGFMTLWLATRFPERFRAAVSLYGISNLASYYGEGVWGYTYGDQAMARRYPWQDEQYFVEHSPLFHAEHMRASVLLLHGEMDTNVPIGEAEQMFTALDLLGKDVELVRFPGEDHGLRGTTENRIAHREMILDWFDKHLRGQDAAWKARW